MTNPKTAPPAVGPDDAPGGAAEDPAGRAAVMTGLHSTPDRSARSDRDAAEFIRRWNQEAIRRSGGIVITPFGRIDADTQRLIAIATETGQPVVFVTRPGHHPEPGTEPSTEGGTEPGAEGGAEPAGRAGEPEEFRAAYDALLAGHPDPLREARGLHTRPYPPGRAHDPSQRQLTDQYGKRGERSTPS